MVDSEGIMSCLDQSNYIKFNRIRCLNESPLQS